MGFLTTPISCAPPENTQAPVTWKLSPLLDLFHWGSGTVVAASNTERLVTLLHALCTLPFRYFSDSLYSCVCDFPHNLSYTTILFPTLATICYGNDENCTVLQHEVSPKLLSAFFTEQTQPVSLSPSQASIKDSDHRIMLRSRWPQGLISDVLLFFASHM